MTLSRRRMQEEKDKKQDYDLHNLDLVTPSTKMIILEKFIKDFEIAMNNFFLKKKDHMINFEEFANLLYALGFIKVPYDAKILEEDEKKEKKNKKLVTDTLLPQPSQQLQQITDLMPPVEDTHKDLILRYRRKTEANTLKDAWKILSNGRPEVDKIDTNQVIVFCSSILGLYNGDLHTEEVIKTQESAVVKPFVLKTEESAQIVKTEENVDTKTLNANPNTNVNGTNNPSTNTNNDKIKKVKMVESQTGAHKSHNKKSNEDEKVYAFGSLSKVATLKSKKPPVAGVNVVQKSPPVPKINIKAGTFNRANLLTSASQQTFGKDTRVLLKLLLPELDLSKYSYNAKTVNQIHSIFHQFYKNRVEYLVEAKRKYNQEHNRSASASPRMLLNESSFTIGNRSSRSAQRWREKVFVVISII